HLAFVRDVEGNDADRAFVGGNGRIEAFALDDDGTTGRRGFPEHRAVPQVDGGDAVFGVGEKTVPAGRIGNAARQDVGTGDDFGTGARLVGRRGERVGDGPQ